MFFPDVAGFTTISEKLNAEQLAAVLNEYLTPMSDIINYGGYIDKYEGDAIMADFMPIWAMIRTACVEMLRHAVDNSKNWFH